MGASHQPHPSHQRATASAYPTADEFLLEKIDPGHRGRRDRARASPLRATAISPSTRAAAPPTTPLPVPGPPLAMATFRPPLTKAISPATRDTMAPILPLLVPRRPPDRRRASPPTTTPTSASRVAVVA